MTRVVNLYREKYDIYIGRGGKGFDGYFGNPFPLKKGSDEERTECLRLYKLWFDDKIATDPEFKRRVEKLRGKTLGCFCHPKRCHGDVIKEYLDSLPV